MNRLLFLLFLSLVLAACGPNSDRVDRGVDGQANEDYERGPNNGRLLRDGDFASDQLEPAEGERGEAGAPPADCLSGSG